MITGTTPTGFEFEVDERVLNDYRFVEALAMAESDDSAKKLEGITTLPGLLLGTKDKKRLMEKISAENDGFIPQEVVYEEIFAIINLVSEVSKNVKN